MNRRHFFPTTLWLLGLVSAFFGASARALEVDLSAVSPASAIRVSAASDFVTVEWPSDDAGQHATAKFRLNVGEPLIESFALRAAEENAPHVIARDLQPFTAITVGSRDLSTAGKWVIFFDKVNKRPSQRYGAQLDLTSVRARAEGNRGSITLGGLKAGPFTGELVFTFHAGSPLIHAEAVVSTQEDARAIIYDAGLIARPGGVERFVWAQTGDGTAKALVPSTPAAPQSTRHRTVIAETAEHGIVAVFPAPHRFLYPLDFAENFGFNWAGRDYASAPAGDGWGVRQPPEGDQRFVPWVNAPPGTAQRLGVFYLLSRESAASTLAAVKRFTHDDRYVALPGRKTFTSHYHIEHTLTLLEKQAAAKTTALPAELENPGFVRSFKAAGVDIVHLAEFHRGPTPKLDASARLKQLRTLHAECARLSDDKFLLLPGEEPNVHLGGHWISFFPKPVLWVLNRPPGTPFVQTTPEGETLYHVASPADVLELMQREHGLMWTAHARIKSSVAHPDAYRDQDFFKSPHFLGAAWKAMPADYSRDTLGWRVLDLLDDMNNWGAPKQAIGEVDIFKVEPDYELYGHMNINYVELDQLPKFADGWAPLLAALRAGRFFTTTGEILLADFTATRVAAGQVPAVRAHLTWTFPLSHAEVVGGDGSKILRHRIDLSQTKAYGTLDLAPVLPKEFAACQWVRLEVWDVAANGAFTQPAHFTRDPRIDLLEAGKK